MPRFVKAISERISNGTLGWLKNPRPILRAKLTAAKAALLRSEVLLLTFSLMLFVAGLCIARWPELWPGIVSLLLVFGGFACMFIALKVVEIKRRIEIILRSFDAKIYVQKSPTNFPVEESSQTESEEEVSKKITYH